MWTSKIEFHKGVKIVILLIAMFHLLIGIGMVVEMFREVEITSNLHSKMPAYNSPNTIFPAIIAPFFSATILAIFPILTPFYLLIIPIFVLEIIEVALHFYAIFLIRECRDKFAYQFQFANVLISLPDTAFSRKSQKNEAFWVCWWDLERCFLVHQILIGIGILVVIATFCLIGWVARIYKPEKPQKEEEEESTTEIS